ncbi:MAG: hypothetical protein EON98_02515 [Chitinophagaceae bacterium]|nr:MAG: hypothetical protein EON98_02515 [Chitinophagaceae bacterium]
MKVFVDKKGRFLKGEITAVKQIGEGIPVLDAGGEVIEKIQELTKQDFPESMLKVSDEGIIKKKN